MPQPLAWYANANYGIGKPSGEPRANILAQDAATAANPSVDFTPYDNDGNGYVDAFIVVHAGDGGEETGDPGDIWSHKWVLPQEYDADGTKIYAYLTIPENAKLGVSAHELGHLLFGFPDLYDIDYSSEGIGNWCLMAGGSWNGGGDTPPTPRHGARSSRNGSTSRTSPRTPRSRCRTSRPAAPCIGCGPTAAPARSTSCWRTASRPASTPTCPGRACSSGTSTTASRPTRTRTTTSSR